MKCISLGLCFVFTSLFGELYAGDFIGKVSVKYKVFSVIEGERFEITCSATHEDKRPELQWYFVNYFSKRTNLTGFHSGGKGNTATYKFSRSRAKLSDSGDYYCFAMVGDIAEEQKTSAGVPIQVIKKDNKPRLRITKTRVPGKTRLKCEVYPFGNGQLSWHHDGYRLKYEKKVSELELEAKSKGEYQCHGNLTLGGYTFYIRNAYATAAAGWSYTTTQTLFTSVLLCFIAFLNL